MHVQACLHLHQKCEAAQASLLLYFQGFFSSQNGARAVHELEFFLPDVMRHTDMTRCCLISDQFIISYLLSQLAAANMFLCTSLCDCNMAKRSPLKPLVKLKDVMYFSNSACVALLMIQNTYKFNWSGV